MSVAVDATALRSFVVDLLTSNNADHEQASVFATALVWSDLMGRSTHGVWRLASYMDRYLKGLINCPCQPQVEQTGSSTLTIDGDAGFGHFLGHKGMQHAIGLAADSGVGVVTVRNSNHFGCAGYFASMAAEAGMFGIATSNSIAKLAAPGGTTPIYGTNPIAFGSPVENAPPIILDMATAAASGTSVIRAAEKGLTLPEGILVDRDGKPVTDPALAKDAAMLPFGGAKGGGIAMIVEILSAVLSGAALSTDVRSMFNDFSGSGKNGHCFIAIDIKRLIPLEIYYQQMALLLRRIKDSAGASGTPPRLPGEQRWSVMQQQSAHGVDLESQVYESLVSLARDAKIDAPAPL